MSIQFIDKTGEIALETNEFVGASRFSEDLAVVKTDRGKCGFIDKSGAIIIEPKFATANPFSESLSVVKMQEGGSIFQPYDKFGVIDKTGELVFEDIFDSFYDFSDGIAVAKKGEEFFFVDKIGLVTLSIKANRTFLGDFKETKFSEGLIVAFDVEKEKYGFINKSGEFVIEPKFKNASNFSEGLARVSIVQNDNEYLGFINRKGEFVIPPKFDIDWDFNRNATGFSEGLASLIKEPPDMIEDSTFMYIDKTGKISLETSFFYASRFHEGLASVWDEHSEKWGFIDKSGELVIDLKYSFAGDFSEGLAIVQV